MPIFEFRCKNCNKKFEELVFSASFDVDEIICPDCGTKNAEKLMSAFCSSGAGETSYGSSAPCGRSGFS